MIYILNRKLLPYSYGDPFHETSYVVLSHHESMTQDMVNDTRINEGFIHSVTVDYINTVRWVEALLDSITGDSKIVVIFNDRIPLSLVSIDDDTDNMIVKAVKEYKVIIREEKLDLILYGKQG